MLSPGQATAGSWMRRNLLRLSSQKAGVTLVSREKELEEWAKIVTDASIERECHSPAKFTARADCTASNKISPSWRRRNFFFFRWNFSPWLFDLTNSLQLEHLWHGSGCQLCPTCDIFYLVKLLMFWSQGCMCIMEEHPGVWHVRIAPWTRYGHSFWPDCWLRGMSFVYLFDQDQRQSSSSSLSPRAPFSSAVLLVSEILPPMMYHPLPWATSMLMGVFFLFAVLACSRICFSAFSPNQHWAHALKHHVRGKRWLSWGRTSGSRVWDTNPHGLYQSTERQRDGYQ